VPIQAPWHHRRVSVDSAQFQRANFAQQQTFHHPDNDNVILEADSEELTPTPPYSLHAPSAIALSPSSVTRTSSSSSSGTTDPAQSLEEFRHSLNHTLRHGGKCHLISCRFAFISAFTNETYRAAATKSKPFSLVHIAQGTCGTQCTCGHPRT